MLYGSGLRTDQTLPDGSTVPNGGKLSPYAQVNLTANHHFSGPGIDIRFDVIKLADHKYEIRDGGGVGVGAPQYGPRRGVFFGISKAFGQIASRGGRCREDGAPSPIRSLVATP